MSQFLPEAPAPRGDSSGIRPAVEANINDKDLELAARVVAALVARPQQLIGPLMGYIADAMGLANLLIPVGQLVGFTGFTPQGANYIDTNESTTSGSYTDLATVGPTLSEVAPGSYLLLYGSTMSNESGSNASVAPSVNGAGPAAGTAIVTNSTANIPGATARLVDLPSASNTVKLQYASSSGNTSHFGQRWLIAIKYANL